MSSTLSKSEYTMAKNRESASRWYYEHREQVLEQRKLSKTENRAYCQKKQREWKKTLYELLGNKCVRCGYSDERALQVDHINGGGSKKRSERSRCYYAYYRQLSLNPDTPKHFQLLCANCNWIKRYENGEINQHIYK